MSISNSYPTQRPVFSFNADAGKLDSRISYSRSSVGTFMSNEKALSSENLLPYSNDLSQSVWTKARVTVASTNNTAPDGSSTASSLLETTDNSSHTFYDNFECVSGQQYSFVIYLKANGRTKVSVSPQATATIATVQYDLTAVTGTVLSGSTDSPPSITAIGSTGWYKCALTVTATATGTGYSQVNLRDASGNSSYTGEVSKGVFAWGASVSSTGQTVVNQTSGSIHREYAPLLKTAAADAPRFEYAADGQSVGTALGLLVESQSSNLFARSSGFDYSAAWTKTNVTATAEAISPDATLNAFAIRETDGGGTKRIHQAATVAAGSVAVSVYAKILGNERRLVIREDTTTGDSAVFDLSSGTVAATNVGGAGLIEAAGGGWYRCTLITSPGSGSKIFGFWLASGTGTNYESYTGDGFSGLLLYGAQCENASAPSSYIESLGTASVTRAADSCSVALSEINYSGGEVSLLGEGTSSDQTNYRGMLSLHLDSSNFISLYAHSAYNRRALIKADGVGSELSGGAGTKAGLSVGTNDVSLCVDGGAVTTDASQTLPDLTGATAYVGSWSATSNQINGHIKRLSLYSVALSDTELQALTS